MVRKKVGKELQGSHPSLVVTTFVGAVLANVGTSFLNVVIVAAAADVASVSAFAFFDRFCPVVVGRLVARPF